MTKKSNSFASSVVFCLVFVTCPGAEAREGKNSIIGSAQLSLFPAPCLARRWPGNYDVTIKGMNKLRENLPEQDRRDGKF